MYIGVVHLIREVAGLDVVCPLDGEDLAQEFLNPLVKNRRADLHTSVKVAGHPVGRANVGAFVAVVAE